MRFLTNVGHGVATYNVKVRAPQGFVVVVTSDKLLFGKRNEKKSYTVTISNCPNP